MLPVVPADLIPELIRLRWQERLSYRQIQARHPYYSRRALERAIKQASHRTYYQTVCGWCEQRFRTRFSNQRFCSERCREQHRDYHYRLGSATRPPEIRATWRCPSCAGPIPLTKQANATYCSERCRRREAKRRQQAKRKGDA